MSAVIISPANLVTAPAHCALAIALPLDHDAFSADLAAGTSHDFSSSTLRGTRPEVAWAKTGAPLAELCGGLLQLAETLGVKVLREARLGDLAALFRDHSVVTIVAHWRGALLVGADLRDEPSILLERIRAGTDPLCRDLAERLTPALTDPVLARPTLNDRRSAFAQLVNGTVIRSGRPLPGCVAPVPNGVMVAIDDLTLESLHRDRLDRSFPDLLRPGNRVELRDGLHSPASIAATVPSSWNGIVDFVICRSAYLAHTVKDRKPERQIITNVHEVIPGVRLRIQMELYRRLAKAERNYAVELMAIFRELAETDLRPPRNSILKSFFRFFQGDQS
jgi:hypothetical protein